MNNLFLSFLLLQNPCFLQVALLLPSWPIFMLVPILLVRTFPLMSADPWSLNIQEWDPECRPETEGASLNFGAGWCGWLI